MKLTRFDLPVAITAFVLAATTFAPARAQTSTASISERKPEVTTHERYYFYEPRPLPAGRSVTNLGLSLDLLPAPLVEQEIPVPILDFQIKYGLSPHFALFGSASTNYFTNIVTAGLQWNSGSDALSYSIGNAVVGFAGFLDMGGEFDRNTAAAIADLPVVRIGRRFGRAAVSLSVAASYVLYANTHIGSLEDQGLESSFNDVYFTLAVEQPFFGEHLVSTGLSITYTRTPYQIWMLYNTFDQYLIVPEFFFAFQL